MASENSVTLVGNVTKDPELRYTTGGRGVASFGLAVNRRYQVNGEWQEQVSFFNIVAWGDLGVRKGAQVVNNGIFGTTEFSAWRIGLASRFPMRPRSRRRW